MHEPGFERGSSDSQGGEGEDEEGEGEFTIVTAHGKEGQNSKKKEDLDTLDG
jgi:hypothetical protein